MIKLGFTGMVKVSDIQDFVLHKPVVILSNNDGCAVARSNEVKALGVGMGAPWFKFKDLAKQLSN